MDKPLDPQIDLDALKTKIKEFQSEGRTDSAIANELNQLLAGFHGHVARLIEMINKEGAQAHEADPAGEPQDQ
jgi:hypothetical protein